MSTSVFTGKGSFHGRELLGGTGTITLPPDPLAGIPSLLDLRTHRGDKRPFGINHVPNGANALWHGITGSATQATATARPLTKFASDGTPYLDFDGVDDWMSVGVHGGKVTYTILVRSKQEGSFGTAYSSFCDLIGGDLFDRWGLIEANGIQMHFNPSPTSTRFNGEQLSQATATFPENVSDWNVITIETYPAFEAGVERGLCRGANFLSAEIIAFFLHDGSPSDERIEAVENHFMSLKPRPLADIPMLMHLKTSEGLYKDASLANPATNDGDLIYQWRDEDTGVFLSQNDADFRPILRVGSNGKRWLDFSDRKALIGYNFPIAGSMSWGVIAKLGSSTSIYGRALSFCAPGVRDYASLSTICAVLRDAESDAVGAYYNGERQGWSPVTPGEWFTDVTRKTASQISVRIGDHPEQITNTAGHLNSSIVVLGGQDAALDSWNSVIADVLIGPWTDDQALRVKEHLDTLRLQMP